MRELYSVTQTLKELFHLETINDFGDLIKKSIEQEKFEELLKTYTDWLDGDEYDWIQAVYQYNQAERNNLKQDYTPESLSKLLAQMINEKPEKVYDVCSGSGSLTLQVHNIYPDAQYILHELDEIVIPYLLLNLALHNVNAIVINGNVLTGEIFKCYRVQNRNIQEIQEYVITQYDVVISNPPFNLPEDGNMKFLKHTVEHSTKQALIILHKPPIKSRAEKEYMQKLLDNNLLHRVIYNPDRLFISTTTSTSILEVRHNKPNNSLYLQDCTYYHDTYTRHQNGQFGGNSHTKRTYHKQFNYYNEEQIENIAHIWRGPRTLEWGNNYTKAEDIPLNLMLINPIGMLYGDSEEIQQAIEEQNIKRKQKEQAKEDEINKQLAEAIWVLGCKQMKEILGITKIKDKEKTDG